MEIADGLELMPGDDGGVPVRVRWVALAETPEAFAVDQDLVFVAGFDLVAFNLADGSVAWQFEAEDGLEADGGVVIGHEGGNVVRVRAPWNYDLRVDRRTGSLLSLEGESSAPLTAFPAPEPTQFHVKMGLEEIVGVWPDGGVAWRLVVESPFVDEGGVVQAGDALVLTTSGQHIVVLDPVDA